MYTDRAPVWYSMKVKAQKKSTEVGQRFPGASGSFKAEESVLTALLNYGRACEVKSSRMVVEIAPNIVSGLGLT